MNRPKNQHWVPQFYLRHFATPDTRGKDQAQVWVLSREEADGDERLTNVRNICAKRYLYSPVGESGERTWDLDREIESLEHTLAQIWPMLATDYMDLSDLALRKGVSLFVAVMHLRNPDTLRSVEGMHRRLVALFDEMPRRPDGTPDVDSVEIAGEVHPLDASGWHAYRAWGSDDHHRFFTHLIRSEAVGLAELLMTKRWSIIVAEHDTFVTSDKPVAIQHRTKSVFGVRTPGTIVSFPISPTRLLVMDDMRDEPANQYYPLEASMSGAFNHNIWHNGSRFMITGRPVMEVLSELVGWADSLAGREG